MDYRGNAPIQPESFIPAWVRNLGKFAPDALTGIAAYSTAAAITGFATGYVGGVVLQREFPERAAKSIAVEATNMVPEDMRPDAVLYYPLKAQSWVMRTSAQAGFAAGDVVYDLLNGRDRKLER